MGIMINILLFLYLFGVLFMFLIFLKNVNIVIYIILMNWLLEIVCVLIGGIGIVFIIFIIILFMEIFELLRRVK